MASRDSIRWVCLGNQDVLIARLRLEWVRQQQSLDDPTTSHELFAELVRYVRELRTGGHSFQDVWEELRRRADARWMKDDSWKAVGDDRTPTDPRWNRISNPERPAPDPAP